jgi:hypothetical protein
VGECFRWEPEQLPFRRVHIDWANIPRIGEVLICVDSFSGWPEAFVCRSRSSSTVLKCLKCVFARFGVPRVLVSDNAKEFISEDVVCWLKNIGCEKVQTPQYSARSNGVVERMVQTVKRAMKLWSAEKGEFVDYLQKALLTYRTSRTVGQRSKTPAELVLGYEVRHPLIGYDIGQRFMYYKNPTAVPVETEFVLQNSKRTVHVVKSDGGMALAHVDQLRPMADTVGTDMAGVNGTAMAGANGTVMAGTDGTAMAGTVGTDTAGTDGTDLVGTETDPDGLDVVDQSVAVRRYPVRERMLPDYYRP